MRRNLFCALLLCAAALLFPAAPCPAQQAQSAAQAAALAAQYGRAASLQYAVCDGDALLLSGAVGDAPEGALYGIGSVSKVYTAAAAMKLADEGALSLDAPVCDVLPEFTMADARCGAVTLRMLLDHSSGLMLAGMKDAFLFDDPQDETAVSGLLGELSQQRLIAGPGEYSVYCNAGFTLAQLAVERAGGRSLIAQLREAFLDPLGLEDTFACAEDFDRSRLASVYWPAAAPARPVACDSTTVTGTGGLYATAADLARFGAALCFGRGLLSDGALREMAAPQCERGAWPQDAQDDAIRYGLGWDAVQAAPFRLSGIQALVKGGDTNQYHAALVVLPEQGLSAAVVSSGGSSVYNQLLAERLLLDELISRGVPVVETAALPDAPPAPMPEALTALSGAYAATAALLTVEISADGTLLLTQEVQGTPYTQAFTYRADGRFHDTANAASLALITDGAGRTYLEQRAYTAVPGLTLLGTANYCCQRLPENPVSADVQAAWAARDGRRYLLLDAKHTSQLWALAMPCATIALDARAPGYVGANRIASETLLEAVLQIPGTAGRDTADVRVTQKDGAEYLSLGGYTYAQESAARPLADASEIVIAGDGLAQWFTVDEALDGRTLRVALPDSGSFAAYAADETVLASSGAYGDTAAPLAAGGWVVFAGEPGTVFRISLE